MGFKVKIKSDHGEKLKCPVCGESDWEGSIYNYGEIGSLTCTLCGYEVEFGDE